MMIRSYRTWTAALAGISFIFGAIGFLLLFLSENIIRDGVKKQSALLGGSPAFDRWKTIDAPIYVKTYFFNVTNPNEVSSGADKQVRVEEIGPFTFSQRRTKNITNYEDDKITFMPINYYEFEPSKSCKECSLDVKITYVNVPLMGYIQQIRDVLIPAAFQLHPSSQGKMHNAVRFALSAFEGTLRSTSVFPTVAASKLLFEGNLETYLQSAEGIAKRTKTPFVRPLPDNTFGIWYQKNGTAADGTFEINTGRNDVSLVGTIQQWNGLNHLTQWKKEPDNCNKLQGTDGTFFNPNLQQSQTLFVFNAELCRSLPLVFEKEEAIMGINTYKFVAPKTAFASPNQNPENECYCTRPDNDRKLCEYSGMMDLSACRGGAPILMSAPHFLEVSPEILKKVNGTARSKALHETFLNIEPRTGQVIKAAKRVMISVELQSYSRFKMTEKLPQIIVPFAWMEESAEMDDKSKALYDKMLGSKVRFLQIFSISLFVGGLIGFFLSVILYLLTRNKDNANIVTPANIPSISIDLPKRG